METTEAQINQIRKYSLQLNLSQIKTLPLQFYRESMKSNELSRPID